MQLRATATATTAAAAAASLVLLSSSSSSQSSSFLARAAYVSNPNALPAFFSSRVRRRVLARSLLLEASPLPTSSSSSSSSSSDQQSFKFAASGTRQRTRPSMNHISTATSNKNGRSNANEDDENDAAPSTSKANDVLAGISSNRNAKTGSPLAQIVDNQKEFEINLGRAIDTLRSDYPTLLTKNPSWNIYHSQLEVIDPSGVSLMGLENYKMAFSFIHGVVSWFYCEEKSSLTSVRVGYDWARKCIRVSWNVELVPKMIYGGIRRTHHVDGISEYYLDRDSGLITEHKVTHLLINDQAVRPVNGIFRALAEISPVDHDPEGIPVLSSASSSSSSRSSTSWEDLSVVKFQMWHPLHHPMTTSLFSISNEQAMNYLPDNAVVVAAASSNNSNNNNMDPQQNHLPYDRDALQRKNASRKKFGMPPLTPEEFIKIEEEVRAMDVINKKKAAYLAEKLAQQSAAEKKKKEDSFLSNIFGGVLKNGCESNFDCERPQVCCDVGFKKICCSNGLGIVDGIPVERYERGSLRVPLPNDNYGDEEDW